MYFIDMHVPKNQAQSGMTHNVSSMVYPCMYAILLNCCIILCYNYAAAKSVQSPPSTTNRLQAPNNSRPFASKNL